MPLPAPWQVTPLGVAALAVGIAHEIGLRHLKRRQGVEARRHTRLRSLAFYGGLVILIVFVSGPFERWAVPRSSVQMAIFVFEAFYLPPLLIIGGPFVPLLFTLSVEPRRRMLRTFYVSKPFRWLRALSAVATSPVAAIILFSAVVVVWFVPAVYDWTWSNGWAFNWLAAPSFIVSGYLFWRVILPSHPSPSRGSTRIQIMAIILAVIVMQIFAMAMVIFTTTPWYPLSVALNGSVLALREQHLAAALLWIGGDLGAVAALALVASRIMSQSGSISDSLERFLGRV